MKKIASLLALLLCVSSLAGCSPGTSGDGAAEPPSAASENAAPGSEAAGAAETQAPEGREKIIFWHSMGSRNGTATEAIVNAFNESQDNIFVEAQYQGSYDDSIAKLKSTPEGSRPDVMQLFEVGSLWMINSDYFIPAQEYIDRESFDISDYQDNILAWYTINDTIYSIPFNSSVPALSYNVEALEAAGVNPETDLVTLDGVLAAAEKVVGAGSAKYGACLDNDAWLFEQYIAMQGAYMTDNENGRAGLATRLVIDENGAGLNLLEIWRTFSTSPYTITYGSGGSGTAEAKKEFGAGNVAMLISTCGNFRDLQDGAAGSFTVAQRGLPKLKAEDPYMVSIGGASLWIISNGERTKADPSWEFIKFCADPEMQAQWVYSTGYLPVSKRATEQDIYQKYLEENPGFRLILDELHETTPKSCGALIGVSSKFRSIVQNEIQMLLNDEAYTTQEALDSIVSQTNDEIQLYNESNGLV